MIDPKNLNTAKDAPPEPQLFHYSELEMAARYAALDSYRDACDEPTIFNLVEGDLVDHMDSFGPIFDEAGTLAE